MRRQKYWAWLFSLAEISVSWADHFDDPPLGELRGAQTLAHLNNLRHESCTHFSHRVCFRPCTAAHCTDAVRSLKHEQV